MKRQLDNVRDDYTILGLSLPAAERLANNKWLKSAVYNLGCQHTSTVQSPSED